MQQQSVDTGVLHLIQLLAYFQHMLLLLLFFFFLLLFFIVIVVFYCYCFCCCLLLSLSLLVVAILFVLLLFLLLLSKISEKNCNNFHMLATNINQYESVEAYTHTYIHSTTHTHIQCICLYVCVHIPCALCSTSLVSYCSLCVAAQLSVAMEARLAYKCINSITTTLTTIVHIKN